MISKEKMHVIASNVDDSIKSVTPIYDITIFSDFIAFEDYINNTPIKLGSIVISEFDLPFTSVNMSRLIELLAAPFLKLTGPCIYLIGNDTSKESVSNFLEDNGIDNILVYQGDLSSRYISDIISGAARMADEEETEIVTYRMRASEYAMAQNIKKYENDDDYYLTDEEAMSQIPSIEEPEVYVPAIDISSNSYYVVGKSSYERTLFTFIEAQYLSLTGKTVIVESDIEYHRLTDIAFKSSVNFDYIDIESFYDSPLEVVNNIKASTSKLILLGCKNRFKYNYDFIFDILTSNLRGYVDYLVKECDYSQTPYGSSYTIVCPDTVPDVLECCSSLAYDIEPDKVSFVGVRTSKRTDVNISSSEMKDILTVILEKDNLKVEVVEACGINLKGDNIIYDVLSVIGRGNERQGGGI